jgi:uncharacterized membrane protein
LNLNISTIRALGASMFAFTPGNAFWPYFAGLAILAIGLFATWKEVSLARWEEKLFTLGRVFFAAPMAVFAAQHFTDTKFVAKIVPSWMPEHVFWTYLVGTALIAAALSIVVKKQARLAAILLGVLLILFVLLIHIPNIIAHPKNVLTWALGFRDLAFSGGALAFAGTQTEKRSAKGASTLVGIARIFILAPAIFFGIAHFVHPEFLPCDDLDQLTPTWIPGHVLWAYVAGVVFVVVGLSMLLNWRTRLAATCLGIMALVLLVFVFLPMVAHNPSNVESGLNYFVSTLAFSGTALLLAAAMPVGDQARKIAPLTASDQPTTP